MAVYGSVGCFWRSKEAAAAAAILLASRIGHHTPVQPGHTEVMDWSP